MAPFKSKLSLANFDYCVTCDKKNVIFCCDNCDYAVCDNKDCCVKFPQYNKDDYVLCKYCIKQIENNFKQLKEPEPEPIIHVQIYR